MMTTAAGLLTRDQVRRAIYHQHPTRVPLAWMQRLCSEMEQLGPVQELMARYPEDIINADIAMPAAWEAPADDPDYRWALRGQTRPEGVGHWLYEDGLGILESYARLDEFLAQLPNPERRELVREAEEARAAHPNRYILGHFWAATFERLRFLRGTEAALTDLYDYPEQVHRLLGGVTRLYRRWIARLAEAGCDGVIFDDDLGTQRGPLITPRLYREFIKPYQAEIVACIHCHGMDAWLHSCGDVTAYLDDFVEIGLDVLHPLQAGTMDWPRVAASYGDRLCFLVGVDIQRVLPRGTPEQIARAVEDILDCFVRPEGGLMLGVANLITADVSLDRLEAFWSAAWCAVRRRAFPAVPSDARNVEEEMHD